MRRILWIPGVALVALASSLTGSADAQQIKRVRGTIAAVSADTLTIHTADGSDQTVKIAPNARFVYDKALTLADIKAGDFIGTAADKQADGRLVALEVTVFPAAMRGAGEGQRPWDQGPNSSMTNANVDEIVTATSGRTLKLSYKGGTAEVDVPPDAPIVTPVVADRSLLVSGKAVVAFMRQGTDGTDQAASIAVEKDGVKPP